MSENNQDQQFFDGQHEDNNLGNGSHNNNDGADANNQANEVAGGNDTMSEDADLFDIKQRVKGMDEEAARLIQLQNEMEQQMKSAGSPTTSKKSAENYLFIR